MEIEISFYGRAFCGSIRDILKVKFGAQAAGCGVEPVGNYAKNGLSLNQIGACTGASHRTDSPEIVGYLPPPPRNAKWNAIPIISNFVEFMIFTSLVINGYDLRRLSPIISTLPPPRFQFAISPNICFDNNLTCSIVRAHFLITIPLKNPIKSVKPPPP